MDSFEREFNLKKCLKTPEISSEAISFLWKTIFGFSSKVIFKNPSAVMFEDLFGRNVRNLLADRSVILGEIEEIWK